MPIVINCESCGIQVRRSPSHLRGRVFCSRTCRAQGITKKVTDYRRMRRVPDHPLAPPSGLVSVARIELYDRIGPGPHPCHWCGKLVDWFVGRRGNPVDGLVADHLDNNPLNDVEKNVIPSCGTCNGVRTQRVQDDESHIVRKDGTRIRVGERRTCKTCGRSFLTTTYLRNYCSRSHYPYYQARRSAK